MSDKSFGDHMSRGIVKNPLLSTAVTGLSIDDLTQNAVLLPVSRTQELFGRQEPTPNITLASHPSGDSLTPIQPPTPPAQVDNAKKDDFDVSEYFARLQGTTYTSAPINSHIKENTNLEAEEENLEEINLNEAVEIEKERTEEQQSITADIAQNFSQLPTVLPQVASAVFSSFSNMLSMKREQVEEKKESVQDVLLMGVTEAPAPMKEPPVTGPGNYRLTTKKKYAQIPGLSSGETAQMPTYTPPAFNQPIFTPPQQNYNENFTNNESNVPTLDVGQTNVDFSFTNTVQNIPVDKNSPIEAKGPNAPQITQDFGPQATIIPPPPMFSNLAKRDSLPNVGKSILPPSVARRIGSNKPTISHQAPTFATYDNIFVPAPIADTSDANASHNIPLASTNPTSSYSSQPGFGPMPPANIFSANVPSNVTSVASSTGQLTSASQIPSSILPTNNVSASSPFSGNLPPPPTNTFGAPPVMNTQGKSPSFSHSTSILAPQQFAGNQSQPVAPPPMFTPGKELQLTPRVPPANIPQSAGLPTSAAPPPIFVPGIESQSANNILPPRNIPQSVGILPSRAPPPIFPGQKSQLAQNIPSTNIPQSAGVAPLVAPPSIFVPGNQLQSTESLLLPTNLPSSASGPGTELHTSVNTAPPQMFNPNPISVQPPGPAAPAEPENQYVSILQSGLIEIPSTLVAEPPNIPKPPTASGTNFRMTKKRPQYYSGPIEGIGAISNNVKPTLAPVAPTGAFQGAVFTPEANAGHQAAVFTPENITSNIAHDMVNPAVSDNQSQSSMFTPLDINVKTSKAQYNVNTSYAFDINKPAENPNYSQFDINKAPEPYSYTAFDVSRQPADTNDPPKQESAFGIIGSLKSKLSSIDINKLQSSVTTFFDPSYNVTNKEAHKEYEPTYGQNQGIEICVANPDTHPQPYNYDAHQTSFTYSQGAIPNPSDYYNQQAHNVYSTNSYYSQPSHGTQNYSQTELQEQQQTYTPYSNMYDPASTVNTDAQVENVATYQSSYELKTEDDTESPQSDNLAISLSHFTGFTQDKDNAEITDRTHIAVDHKSTEPAATLSEKHVKNENTAIVSNDQFEGDCKLIEKPRNDDNLEEKFKNLQIKDEASAVPKEETALNKHILESVNDATSTFIDNCESLKAEKAFLDLVDKKNSVIFFDTLQNSDRLVDMQKQTSLDNMFSAPLHDLSSMIAAQSKETSGENDEVDDDSSLKTEADYQTIHDRLMTLDDSNDEDSQHSENAQTTEFNICETCREVNQPEQKATDLTSKLIENITAPIQLLNPVEAPLTEISPTLPDDFDTINQGAEISLITDETIETLQVQSAIELLDDDGDANVETNYGWRTEAPLPLGQDLLDHDYNFKTDPKAMGFFANNSLFLDNIPNDEIKTEYIISKDDGPAVLERQMSIPTAPPAEDFDDDKSDETGILDVLSIEQDASKDFPVFEEEYVIEPSETDDEKIEFKDKIDEPKDTFTSRVDRAKKIEENEDITEQKGSSIVSSSTMMPSYFDTGNYAVETHYRNSLTSPTISRIPPGFEDHYELRPKEHKQFEAAKLPDKSCLDDVTGANTVLETLTSTPFSEMPEIVQEQPKAKLPDFASVFGAKIELKDTTDTVSDANKTVEKPTLVQASINLQANAEDNEQKYKMSTLPDPMNFFASPAQEPSAPEGVNRLASYFASPAKTDNTKSFFELSQGQDHYRQDNDTKNEGHKTFFELGQSQDHYKDIANIPHDKYIANLNLMKDLTSIQNIEPSKEQIVKTVHYFTVEYDNPSLNFNKGEPNFTKTDAKQENANTELNKEITEEANEKEETVLNDEILTEIINKCKYCSNPNPVSSVGEVDIGIGKVQVRQAMDASGSSPKKGSAAIGGALGGQEKTVSVRLEEVTSEGDSNEEVAMMSENRTTNDYDPVKHHWFYRVDAETEKSVWRGFSTTDSKAIETAFLSPDLNEATLVPTDGGRYDVNVVGRLRTAVYWSDTPTNVRRCSWFYKGTTDARYVPYTEGVAEKLEVEYRHGITTGSWHRRLVLPNNELVVMHGPQVMVHFLQASSDPFSASNLFSFGKRVYRNPPKFKSHDLPPKIDHLLLMVHGAGEWRHQKNKIVSLLGSFKYHQSTMRPRVVRRGIDESEIEDPEPSNIDHLLLLCHGVGSACDMRFRAVEEVVDDFRATSLQLLQSHYRNSYDNGIVGRVEVLPISWHASLHSGPRGVDRRLARVTLASIPRLRQFTNDTVLDVLFYTSPVYCQMILDTVCGELNRIYTLFTKRNPDFKGNVSLGGHSLGSVILYDLLCNQPIPAPMSPKCQKIYLSGTLANNPAMEYPTLCFEPLALYALGSPIAIFECIRGVESLGVDFFLPTCRNFFNIFHPYDPIAYRIEPLVNPQLQNVKPSLIPHHKGRKRMHLELKDTMARVGADLKQKLVESIRSTWSSMWSSAAPPDHQLEKVVEEEIEKDQLEEENSKEEPMQADVTPGAMLGRLNAGRRIDHVLQEAPFEMINEYLFAMTSHVCYWESEDVMLLILREIYDSMGVQPDVTVPQQSMSVQRTVVRDGEGIATNSSDASTSRVS